MDILKLVNRTDRPLEFMFDSITYNLDPGETQDMSEAAARHGNAKLIAMLDPVTNMALFLTGLKDRKGKPLTDCSKLEYHPKKNQELLDRSNIEGNFREIGRDAENPKAAPVATRPAVSVPKPPAPPTEEFPDADAGLEEILS